MQLAGRPVRVIAGQARGIAGAVQREVTTPLFLDLHLSAGAGFEQALPAAHNAFVYVYRGSLDVAGTAVPRQRMAILANRPEADGVALTAGARRRAGDPGRRAAAGRADRAVRALRDEHEGGDPPGGGGLPPRRPGLTAPYSTISTPFQKATRPLICAAASLGSG